jgi:phage-related protein
MAMDRETQKNQAEKKQTLWYKPSILDEVRTWPKEVTEEVGRQLNKVEYGGQPIDFKPMSSIGSGVFEIRHSDDGEQYRLIYVAKFKEAIYVLHVITKKKTRKTAQHDIDLAKERYNELVQRRKRSGYE